MESSKEQQEGAGAPKKHIDEYEFIKQVGEGAFGNVYLAKEKAT
jgi:serine/threonine protein kinase